MVSTWLPSSSDSAGPLPLYGTCSTLMPAMLANSSIAKWLVVPAPAEAIVSLPGRAFAAATTPAIELKPDFGLASTTSGTACTVEIGAKSFNESYGSFLKITGLTDSGPLEPTSSV